MEPRWNRDVGGIGDELPSVLVKKRHRKTEPFFDVDPSSWCFCSGGVTPLSSRNARKRLLKISSKDQDRGERGGGVEGWRVRLSEVGEVGEVSEVGWVGWVVGWGEGEEERG